MDDLESEYQKACEWAKKNCLHVDCVSCQYYSSILNCLCPYKWRWAIDDVEKKIIISKYHELKAMQEKESCVDHKELAGRKDQINQPSHYTQGNIEVRDFIVDQKLNYNRGNIVKYVCRAEHKGNELEDMKKAMNYLQYEIAQLEGK